MFHRSFASFGHFWSPPIFNPGYAYAFIGRKNSRYVRHLVVMEWMALIGVRQRNTVT